MCAKYRVDICCRDRFVESVRCSIVDIIAHPVMRPTVDSCRTIFIAVRLRYAFTKAATAASFYRIKTRWRTVAVNGNRVTTEIIDIVCAVVK